MLASVIRTARQRGLNAGDVLADLLRAPPDRLPRATRGLTSLTSYEELWRRSALYLPSLGASVPGWAKRLGELHKFPYALRYPVGIHGLVLPNAVEIATELSEIDTAVRNLVRG